MQLKTVQRPVIEKNHDHRQGDNHGFAHKPTDKREKNKQIPSYSRFFRVIDIKTEGKHPEKSA